MDEYEKLMDRTYKIAQAVLNHNGWHEGHKNWHFTKSSIPQKLSNGQLGWEIAKIQYGEDGEYGEEVNGIEAIAAKDCNGVDYFSIAALADDPETMRFDASDIEIAAMIGRCAQVTEDFLEAYNHAWN
jgi:hypothetical protein